MTSPTPTPTPTATPAPAAGSADDAVNDLPNWLVVALLCLVVVLVLAMFALTYYNLKGPRWTLNKLLARDSVDQRQVGQIARRAGRVAERTTRTVLATAGFALLAISVLAIFASAGPGVRDLRSQVIGAITTLLAAISGFYFGTRATTDATAAGAAALVAPTLVGAPQAIFTVGRSATYRPVLLGTPAPVVTLTSGVLPTGLALDPATGAITGVPTTSAAEADLVLTALNGVIPPATLTVAVTVVDAPVP